MKDFVTNVDIKVKNHNLCLKDVSKYTRDSFYFLNKIMNPKNLNISFGIQSSMA